MSSAADYRQVSAGSLHALYGDACLRYVTSDGIEILRRLYVAVRDRVWNTIPARILREEIEATADVFESVLEVEHVNEDIDFFWTGRLRLSHSEIEAQMDGVARKSFLKNRIGWCVLQPTGGFAGRPYTVEHVDGSRSEGRLPEFISPHQPFKEMRAYTVDLAPGVALRTECEGDTFEIEDHRNWTDDSFKIYSTPLRVPYPVLLEEGSRVRQTIRVQLQRWTQLDVDMSRSAKWPRLGMIRRAPAGMGLDYVRLEAGETAPEGTSVEAAVHVSGPDELDQVAFARPIDVERWLVFDAGEPATRPETLALARKKFAPLSPQSAFIAGTSANFAELNRNRDCLRGADGLTFSANPQAHGSDEYTIIENLPALAATVQSARTIAPGLPISISPLSLGRNPDPREQTPFGAAWLAIALKYLAESGISSVTLPESLGEDCPARDLLTAVAAFGPTEVADCESSRPRVANALVLRRGGAVRAFVVNLTAGLTDVGINGQRLRLDPYEIRAVDLNLPSQ